MNKYKVYAEITFNCSREIDALDEQDAMDQCEYSPALEWIEGFTIEGSWCEIESAIKIKRKKSNVR